MSLRKHIPNLLTSARVLMAIGVTALLAGAHTIVVFPAEILTFERRWQIARDDNGWLLLSAGLFLLAAITDALDGFLARRWKVISRFGRIMDPFADKLLVIGTFVMLCGPAFQRVGPDGSVFSLSRVEPWMVVVIIGRELLVTSLRGVLEAQGRDFSATLSGKLKMILQSAVVPAILITLAFATPWQGTTTRLALDWAVWLTVIATVLSGVPYVRRAMTLSGIDKAI